MGFNPTPSPSHLYPEELQLKLYQAFIFSIPILISIILLLLLYLFYLKRRTSSSPLQLSLSTVHLQPSLPPSQRSLKVNLKAAKLQTVLFDQVLTTTADSTCCVCLGEFEMEEVLHQIPACRHVFHGECIRLWLLSNATCPLCRCFIAPKRCRMPKQNHNSPSSSSSSPSSVVIQVEETVH